MSNFGDHLRAIRNRAIRAGMRLLSVEEICSEGERRPQSASALPRNLKRLREAKGLSPTQLASKAHVSASTIRAMETSGNYDIPETGRAGGKGPTYDPNPTLTTLLAVAEALGVRIGDLVEVREP